MSADQLLIERDKLIAQGANEAETRLKLIDRVLFDVLGWTRDDVSVEERVSEDGKTTFADYVIRTGMTAIVVEAKKIGSDTVEVPNLRRLQLNRKLLAGELGPVIEQARDYARKLSVPFAVATNANYWIIFPAVRTDTVSFHDSSAIVFPTLESISRDDFAEFDDLLSRRAVIAGSLEAELLGRIENQIEERRLNRFYTNSFSKISRHSLFPLIEDAITTAFTEDVVNTDPDLLDKCYVKTPERVRFDSRIGMHISKREAVTTKSPQRPLRSKGDTALPEVIQGAASRVRPVAILVLGSVGAGKTTFLEYTRTISAKIELRPDTGKPYPHWIKIDFRGFSKDKSPLDFIHEGIREYINGEAYLGDYERCVKHAYKKDIDALFRGPLFLLSGDEGERRRRISDLLNGDFEKGAPYNEKILAYAAVNSAVFLVIDNVDQFEDLDVQSGIFSAAMALSHRLRLNLIFSLREATYVTHRSSATFDAFDFDPIAIDSPEIKSVLSKRFFVAKQMLQGRPGHFTAENGSDVRMTDKSIIIELVQGSVLGSEIGDVIEILATGDIRLALRMTREFLQSGYSATGKALGVYQRTGRYRLPPHEALRAIMVGNQAVYREKLSVLGNPFDSWCGRTEAQLLRLFILASLVQHASKPAFQGLQGTEIQRVVREIGFGDEVTKRVLSDLCNLRFAYTMSHSPASFEASFIPSRLGGYVIRNLVADFTFIENVMVDTFIADGDIWRSLREVTEHIYAERDVVKKLRFRRDRAQVFFTFMQSAYAALRNEAIRRGAVAEWCSDPLTAIGGRFRENLDRAEASAVRNYGTA